jgi:hypothetical protein
MAFNLSALSTKRVGAGQENPPDLAVRPAQLPHVALDLPDRRHAKRNAAIHGAEGAGVVAAAGGDLDQKRVRLKGRAENGACVCHDSFLLL